MVLLTDLIGKWQGTNHLWLSPEEPVHKSESSAEIITAMQAQFNEIRYSWAVDGKPQEGRLILVQDSGNKAVKAIWFDTWHMMEQFMVCEGRVEADAVSVQGSYAVKSGPGWGWQITIEPKGNDSFRFLMHNITPEGRKMPAVETVYSRLR